VVEAVVGSNPGTVELCGVGVLLQQNYKITPNSIEYMAGRILLALYFSVKSQFFQIILI